MQYEIKNENQLCNQIKIVIKCKWNFVKTSMDQIDILLKGKKKWIKFCIQSNSILLLISLQS